MNLAREFSALIRRRKRRPVLQSVLLFLTVAYASPIFAAGTPAGTVIDNMAEVTFDLGGVQATESSNIASITVVERIDVVIALQSSQVLVAASDLNRSLLFTVTNTGNGTETFALAIDSVLAGDDFDPIPAVPPIYFDTDGSGDFSAGDIAYAAGTNDPVLTADQSVDILLVNDIPAVALNGQLGRSELSASSTTGSGNPGDSFPGQGDGGIDAVVGGTGGTSVLFGEYLVSDVQMNILKSVIVTDQFGNQDPIPGATLTYTVTIEVVNSGTATAAVFSDAIPAGTTYTSNTILLNAVSLTDVSDADAGELNTSATPTTIVRLGDLTQADGIQTVEFQVTIN